MSVDAVGGEETSRPPPSGKIRCAGSAVTSRSGSCPQRPVDPGSRWTASSAGISLLGSHGMAAADYPGMMALVAGGALRPQHLVTRVIGLDEAAHALPGMDRAAGAGITLVDPRL